MKNICIILLVAITCSACGANTNHIPMYDGKVESIMTPTLFRYSPVNISNEQLIIVDFDSKTQRTTSTSKMLITQNSNFLKWHLVLQNVVQGGTYYSHNKPLVEAYFTTDDTGIVLNKEVTLPAFAQSGFNEAQLAATKADLGKMIENSAPILAKAPIQTGDVILSSKMQDITAPDSINGILRGYSFYKGKPVIVVDFDEKSCEFLVHGIKFHGRIMGYYLLDAKTCALVHHDLVATFSSKYISKAAFINISGHGTINQ